MTSFKQYLSRWLPALLWMGLIFSLSAQPNLRVAPDPVWDLVIRKIGHFGVYAVLGVLLWMALEGRTPATSRSFALAALITAAYAVSDEFHQGFVPGRGPSVLDVAIDVAGASFGLGLVALCCRFRTSGERGRQAPIP